jgi:hypothetical protein
VTAFAEIAVRARALALHPRGGRLLLAIMGGVILAGQLALWVPVHWNRPLPPNLDLVVYRRAAERLHAGQPLYQDCARADVHDAPACFVYPPTTAVLLRPLGWLPERAFQRVVYLGLLVGFWAYAAGLARLACGRVTAARVLVAGALLELSPGIDISMSFGNVDVLVWALAAWGLAEQRWLPLLALGGGIKIYPVPALALSVARQRRALVPVALASGALLLAGALAAGPSAFPDWLRLVAPSLREGSLLRFNASLSMGLVRLAGAAGLVDLSGPTLPGAARAVLVVVPLAGLAAVAWLLRRREPRAQAAAVLVAAAWLAPICWWYYAPLLLIPGAVWWRSRAPAPAVTAR